MHPKGAEPRQDTRSLPRGVDVIPLGQGTPKGAAAPLRSQPSQGLKAWIQTLIEDMIEAENANAPAEHIAMLKRKVDLAGETLCLSRGPFASAPDTPRGGDEASQLLRTLGNVKPIPKLGSDN
jgi:hypothetical protein